MNKIVFTSIATGLVTTSLLVGCVAEHEENTGVVAEQRELLKRNTAGKDVGPQSPRDIDSLAGTNPRKFELAPNYKEMNLCNIHFHKNAEHKGGEFTAYAGNGDGKGYNSGYRYIWRLSVDEAKQTAEPICPSKYGDLKAGDTIELHYVHSTSAVSPAPTLGACLLEGETPLLRVETQVMVLTNDGKGRDFKKLTEIGKVNGYYQAVNMDNTTGEPVQYRGSTTGPSYNTKASPYEVTWSVRRQVLKVDINTVGEWCKDNPFKEDHAHGVRNLVMNPALLSPIQ